MKTTLRILISLLAPLMVHAEFVFYIKKQLSNGIQVDAHDDENISEHSDLALFGQKITDDPLEALNENANTLIRLNSIEDNFSNFAARIAQENKANPIFMLNECRNELCLLTRKKDLPPYRDNYIKYLLNNIDKIEKKDLNIILYFSGNLFTETSILISLLKYRTIKSIILIDNNWTGFLKYLPQHESKHPLHILQNDINTDHEGKRAMLRQEYLVRQFLDILQAHNQNQRPELYLYGNAKDVANDIKTQDIPKAQVFLAVDFVYNNESLFQEVLEDVKLLGELMPAGSFFGFLYQFHHETHNRIETTFLQKLREGPLEANVLVLEASPAALDPTSFFARLQQSLRRTWQWTTSWLWPR